MLSVVVLTVVIVCPGDTLTNTYSLNIFDMKWHSNSIVVPGPVGQAAGEVAFSGGLIFDPAEYDNDDQLIMALQ